LVLSVDESSSGPLAGDRGKGCLRVFSDGSVVASHRTRSGQVVIDKTTGKVERSEAVDTRQYKLEDYEVSQLLDFLKSKAVRRLPSSFEPPHRAIDFFEISAVRISTEDGKATEVTVREYYVASLEEKARYPSALIVLMEKIDEIERKSEEKGKPAELSADCHLKE
jgi:hypothetical protein